MSLVGDVGIQLREDPNVRLAKPKIVCFSCLLLTVLILSTERLKEFGEQRHGYLEKGNLGNKHGRNQSDRDNDGNEILSTIRKDK